jgi:hypothetical protein
MKPRTLALSAIAIAAAITMAVVSTGCVPRVGDTAYRPFPGLCDAPRAVQAAYLTLYNIASCDDAYFGNNSDYQNNVTVNLSAGETITLDAGSWPPTLADRVAQLQFTGEAGSRVVIESGALSQFPGLYSLRFTQAIAVELHDGALEGPMGLVKLEWTDISTVTGWSPSLLDSLPLGVGWLTLPNAVYSPLDAASYAAKACATTIPAADITCPAGGYHTAQGIVDAASFAGESAYTGKIFCGLYFGTHLGSTCSSTTGDATSPKAVA